MASEQGEACEVEQEREREELSVNSSPLRPVESLASERSSACSVSAALHSDGPCPQNSPAPKADLTTVLMARAEAAFIRYVSMRLGVFARGGVRDWREFVRDEISIRN